MKKTFTAEIDFQEFDSLAAKQEELAASFQLLESRLISLETKPPSIPSSDLSPTSPATVDNGCPLRPEKFGAKGDNKSDDLPAFDRMMASISNNKPYEFFSTKIELTPGKTYFLSDEFKVLTAVTIACEGGWGRDGTGATLRFAPNKRGLVVHALSTLTGKATGGDDARFSRLYGFRVKGEVGPMTHRVSIDGLTVTKLEGPDFADDLGHHTLNTITINGFEYQMDSTLSSTQLVLREPRVLVNGKPGSKILDHRVQGAGHLPDGQEWADAVLTVKWLDGRVYSRQYQVISITATGGEFASGTIEIERGFDAPESERGYTAMISGVKLRNAPARPNLFHGIDARGHIQIVNMKVEGFAGNGISLDSSIGPTAFSASVPNHNYSKLESNAIYGNTGNGLMTKGVNTNQALILNNDITNNRGAGHAEFGFLGNLYIAEHTSFNGRAGTQCIGQSVNNSKFIYCYEEGGQPDAFHGQNMTVDSGNWAAGISPDSECTRYTGGTAATGRKDCYLTREDGENVLHLKFPDDNRYILTTKDRNVVLHVPKGEQFLLNWPDVKAAMGHGYTIAVAGEGVAKFFATGTSTNMKVKEVNGEESASLWSDGEKWRTR